MSVVELKSADHNQIFDFLIGVIKSSLVPGFSIDGKPERDLVKLARCLPQNKNLSPRHQAAVEGIFTKRQSGYFMTGVNLAHRHNQKVSEKRRGETLKRMALESLEAANKARAERDAAAAAAGKTAN